MAEDKKTARRHFRIAYNADVEKNRVRLVFTPKIKESSLEELHRLLNVLQVGTTAAFRKLLAPLPMLRPPSEEEQRMQVYIMKDEVQDKALYKQRKVLYENLVQEFDLLVEELFPDVRYVDMSTQHQEELAFDLDRDAFEAHLMDVQVLAQTIREENNDDSEEYDDTPGEHEADARGESPDRDSRQSPRSKVS